jgi:Flp pilus assembly protein protease CpaA
LGGGEDFMTRRGIANWLRLVLGVVMAIGAGLVSYMAEGSTLLTYGLPAIILIITLADFIGFLASRIDQSKRPGSDSDA